MKRYTPVALLAAAAILSGACEETSPTATDPALLPVSPTTVEVRIPFSEFGRDVAVTPGFGRVADLSGALVAARFEGALDARTLVRFGAYPASVTVADPAGVVVTDSTLSFIGGRVIVRVDTLSAVHEGPVVLIAGALRGGRWDPRSASWTQAVDTVPDARPWPESGAGPVTILDTAIWDPSEGDSIVFQVDSATVNAWADTTDGSRGLRVSTVDDGVRLELGSFQLSLDVVPSIRPDTVVEHAVGARNLGFVYAPPPPAPGDKFRVGGAPSWRTTFGVQLSDTLTGPTELCDAFGCPFVLTVESVNFAALTLTTATSPPGFQPDDTLALDVRPVLSEDDLPKSPLGSSMGGLLGVRLPPEYFGDVAQEDVTIGVTRFIQDLLRGETLTGDPAPMALSLLTLLEPLSLELLTFEGAGADDEPFLRMILTTRVGVPLR